MQITCGWWEWAVCVDQPVTISMGYEVKKKISLGPMRSALVYNFKWSY